MIDEKRIREIAEQVYAEKTGQSEFTVPKVPIHVHNGIDSPRVRYTDLTGISFIGSDANSVIAPGNLKSNRIVAPSQDPTGLYVIPLPVIESTGLDGWDGGNAPEGTQFLFYDGVNFVLWCRVGGGWHSATLT